MLLIFGMVGIFMKRFGWSRPAFLIGFVLAPQAESYLNMAVQFYGWSMFLRPGVIIILLLSLVSVYFSRRGGVVDESAELLEKKRDEKKTLVPQLLFAAFILGFIVISIFDGLQQSFLGGVFPLTIAFVTSPFALWLIWVFIKKEHGNAAIFDAEQVAKEGEFKSPPFEPIAWLTGLYVATVLIGFVASVVLFFILFLRIKARATWLKTALLTASAVSLLMAFGYFLNLEFPSGYFTNLLGMANR